MFYTIRYFIVQFNYHIHFSDDLCYRNEHGEPIPFVHCICILLHSSSGFVSCNKAHYFSYLYTVCWQYNEIPILQPTRSVFPCTLIIRIDERDMGRCGQGSIIAVQTASLNPLAPELFFFNFSTPCI